MKQPGRYSFSRRSYATPQHGPGCWRVPEHRRCHDSGGSSRRSDAGRRQLRYWGRRSRGLSSYANNPGEVAFNAILDSDVNGDGIPDTGLFVWSQGTLHLVARSGTVIPGVGTIAQLAMAFIIVPEPLPISSPTSGAITNDRGQVYFGATLTDGRGVQLVATPK